MKKIVKFRPMSDITKIVKRKPVVMFKAGELYTGILKPNNLLLGYTESYYKAILIKRSLVIFE